MGSPIGWGSGAPPGSESSPAARSRDCLAGRASSLLELLHGLQRLGDVLRGAQVADGGGDLAVRRHHERRALGEAMVDLVAARVLGARLGFADLEVIALRDLAVRVGSDGDLAGAVLRVRG